MEDILTLRMDLGTQKEVRPMEEMSLMDMSVSSS
jgi:hypothetical protein